MESETSEGNRRRDRRIRLRGRAHLLPRHVAGLARGDVSDVSAGGLRVVLAPDRGGPAPGTVVDIEIRLPPAGTTRPVELAGAGVVTRSGPDGVAVSFTRPLVLREAFRSCRRKTKRSG